MQKCLRMNLLQPTKVKRKQMLETYQTFLAMIHSALPVANGVSSRTELHDQTYYPFKAKYPTASQLIIEATSYSWSHRKTLNDKPKKCVIRFDSRLFSFRQTARRHPVLSLRLNHKRVGLPISEDGAYQRLQEHLHAGWRASSVIMKHDQSFLVVLKKDFAPPVIRLNTIGIDLNSSNIALSVINPQGKILKQTYWAQDLASRQYQFEHRRALLQQYRAKGKDRPKASLKLKHLSGTQRNFVMTNLWQLANDLVQLAKNYQANIAIERLRHLRKRKGQWQKKSQRKTNRIPYCLFRQTLIHVAEQEGVLVKEINPHYTSQRCGHTGKNNWVGYSYFRCKRCHYEAHRDRVASLNLAKRANLMLAQEIQSSPLGSVAVNQRAWEDDEDLTKSIVSQTIPRSSKPPILIGGH